MKIKSGSNFTLLLTDRGEVYSWGKNNLGQLGIGITSIYYYRPNKIDFILGIPIRYISVGNFHAATIDFDYNVYIWGFNYFGQLGLGDNVCRSIPTIIKYLTEKKIEKIYCVHNYAVAITQNGEVYSWGINLNGRLGIGNNNSVSTPTKLNFQDNTIIKKIYAGNYHSYAIDTYSKIYSWGYNSNYQLCRYGELGLGIEKTNKLTIIVEGVEKVWGNDCTVFCKMMNGDVYAWGLNDRGQLGIGNKLNQNIPVKLNMTLDIKSINYCNGMTYAITTNEEIYTWGLNILVDDEPTLVPTLFTYLADNGIDVKTMNRTKSARKIDY